jgi:hypothetical protein
MPQGSPHWHIFLLLKITHTQIVLALEEKQNGWLRPLLDYATLLKYKKIFTTSKKRNVCVCVCVCVTGWIWNFLWITECSHLQGKIFWLTLILLTWRAPNNASRCQMGYNSAFKGLMFTLSEQVCRHHFQLLHPPQEIILYTSFLFKNVFKI